MSKPVFEKLGYKEGYSFALINEPSDYPSLIELPPDIEIIKGQADLDMVHLFSNSAKQYAKAILDAKEMIHQKGAIRVSWYKKSSKLPTELSFDIVQNTALNIGLVDVKVCSVSKEWSGLKFMIPIKDRK